MKNTETVTRYYADEFSTNAPEKQITEKQVRETAFFYANENGYREHKVSSCDRYLYAKTWKEARDWLAEKTETTKNSLINQLSETIEHLKTIANLKDPTGKIDGPE